MIEQGVTRLAQLVVAVGTNPDKRYTFSREERLRLIEKSVGRLPNVRIEHFVNQFLIHKVGWRLSNRICRPSFQWFLEKFGQLLAPARQLILE